MTKLPEKAALNRAFHSFSASSSTLIALLNQFKEYIKESDATPGDDDEEALYFMEDMMSIFEEMGDKWDNLRNLLTETYGLHEVKK
jgi:hypothetical protein